MEYKKHMVKVIDYIENNLTANLQNADLARISCYSEYHFLRLFKYATGLTPADYIRKRRLSEIAKEIVNGNEYISELAFRYGFNSKENFIRAFKNEHHILPSEYKIAENSLKLYEKFIFENNTIEIAPNIVTLEPFDLTVYKSDEVYPPNFWNKYNAKGYSKILSGRKIVKDYGLPCTDGYRIGVKTFEAIGSTESTEQIHIDGGLYAYFATPKATHADFVNTIHKTWSYIYGVWFEVSCYKRRCGYEFECYIESSKTYSEDIYIPIEEETK